MSKNVLVEGKPRIGWMIDGDPDTPEIAVMLELTEESVQLTIATKGLFGRDDPYARWFGSGVMYGDDPEQTKYRYAPPPNILFYDHLGSVVLVGCRPTASSSNSNGAGFGRVVANYAVLGQREMDIDKINGVRTEMPGLAAWTSISSTTTEVKTDAVSRSREYSITLRSPDATRLARAKNLSLQPSWRTSAPTPGTIATHDVIQLVTETVRAEPWENHLAPHRAVQDLLSLSAWRQFGYSRIEVGKVRPLDPDTNRRVAPGSGMEWNEVVTHRLRLHEPWKSEPRFLFTFDDIGSAGVERWIRIRRKYERSMLPLTGVIDQRGMFAETRVMQTGIAVEALGFQLASEQTPSGLNSRGQISYNDAMDVIVADMSVVPVPDVEAWKTRSRLSYMGVKHADNPTPDILTIANAYRENALMLRYWLASKLGCSQQVLRDRLDRDPLSGEYRPA
ncbi:hypothetical protein R2Q81_12855 [Microbacterium aquimaris]|uniref:ApeA N-terminal domain 1-containing protein n=1 Tax=Microbacterium aquimaris TaxID=459816 RepID=UPI002AD1EC15|nr:hypothetical protein [Microbacterium aquimaris]MDZ8276831.1 hypothetical protein [Microbacterium aquimaris]